MFKLTKNPPINRAELSKIIINFSDESANIEYQVGYKEGNDFKSIGVDTLFLQDHTDEETQEEIPDYSDFMEKLNHEATPYDVAIETLEEKGVKQGE